jgi:hypothetical protein
MGNKTPFNRRPRAVRRTRPFKPPPAARPPKEATQPNGVLGLLPLSLRIAAGVVAGLGLFAGWLSLLPSINVEVDEVRAAGREFDPAFDITNNGLITADIRAADCNDYATYARSAYARWPEGWHDDTDQFLTQPEYARPLTIEPGGSARIRCYIKAAPPGFRREEGSLIFVFVSYRSWAFPFWRQKSFSFGSTRSANGQIDWAPEGLMISEDEARRQRQRGQTTYSFGEYGYLEEDE